MTGGRIFLQIAGASTGGADAHVFVKTKSVLELSRDFIQVIR